MTNEELDPFCFQQQLRLGGMADSVPIRAQQARAENLRTVGFHPGLLVHDSCCNDVVTTTALDRRIKAAGFRDTRTLDTFDWKFNTLRSRAHLRACQLQVYRTT